MRICIDLLTLTFRYQHPSGSFDHPSWSTIRFFLGAFKSSAWFSSHLLSDFTIFMPLCSTAKWMITSSRGLTLRHEFANTSASSPQLASKGHADLLYHIKSTWTNCYIAFWLIPSEKEYRFTMNHVASASMSHHYFICLFKECEITITYSHMVERNLLFISLVSARRCKSRSQSITTWWIMAHNALR